MEEIQPIYATHTFLPLSGGLDSSEVDLVLDHGELPPQHLCVLEGSHLSDLECIVEKYID